MVPDIDREGVVCVSRGGGGGAFLTLWLPVNLSEHALVPVSGLVHTLV